MGSAWWWWQHAALTLAGACTDVVVRSGGVITGLRVTMVVSSLAVEEGGVIHSDGTSTATTGTASHSYIGASHGGQAALSDVLPYGSVANPTDVGSKPSVNTNYGGGAIHITAAGGATVDGRVSADAVFLNHHQGGGSGGSVLLSAGSVHGSGAIHARGNRGRMGATASGGSGGRVAVKASSLGSTFSGSIDAKGGGTDSSLPVRVVCCRGRGAQVMFTSWELCDVCMCRTGAWWYRLLGCSRLP